jgi:hypothetical protein
MIDGRGVFRWHVRLREALLLVAGLLAWAPLPVVGAPPAPERLFAHADLMTPEAVAAIERGLAFLAEYQLDDGAFAASGRGRGVAFSALAGMAFLADGTTPDRGPHAVVVRRAIEYLLACGSIDEGLIADPETRGRGPMYGHGFATLFLCETYGMSDEPQLRAQIAAAVQLVVRAQNEEGGWRYAPQPADADVSVTVCQVMALRAARNAGIAVPKSVMDRAVRYVRECQNDDGGFRYMRAPQDQPSGFARTAAGVVALYNAGIYQDPQLDRGLDYLMQFLPGKDAPDVGGYYYYGHYYAVQAMWHAGGDRWRTWYPAIRDQLITRQASDGSWNDAQGKVYATAMACIVLQTPNNLLPILQR